MKNKNFRVRIKNYMTGKIDYKYFDTEREAKAWCINRSSLYIYSLDSYEDKLEHVILYQIQYADNLGGYIPDYGITINRTPFVL